MKFWDLLGLRVIQREEGFNFVMDLEVYLWEVLLGLEGYFVYDIDLFERVIIIGMIVYF